MSTIKDEEELCHNLKILSIIKINIFIYMYEKVDILLVACYFFTFVILGFKNTNL